MWTIILRAWLYLALDNIEKNAMCCGRKLAVSAVKMWFPFRPLPLFNIFCFVLRRFFVFSLVWPQNPKFDVNKERQFCRHLDSLRVCMLTPSYIIQYYFIHICISAYLFSQDVTVDQKWKNQDYKKFKSTILSQTYGYPKKCSAGAVGSYSLIITTFGQKYAGVWSIRHTPSRVL